MWLKKIILEYNLIYMITSSQRAVLKLFGASKKLLIAGKLDSLYHLAFDNSLQANIITIVNNRKIITANKAACKLLGYSKKELISKSRSAIFNINDRSFRKMLKERSAEGHSAAWVRVLKKNGKSIICEITSATFKGENGIEKAITTIVDMSKSIDRQKKIDCSKDKIVAGNIVIAELKQRRMDVKRNKLISNYITLAKTTQRKIDTSKEKIVAENIVLAKSKQKSIDTKKEKVILRNITLAQAKSDARQAENKEWKKYIGKVSYDIMWDWNIITNEIYVGDSIEEVFGYKVLNNISTYAHFMRCLLPAERQAIEKKINKSLASHDKNWNDSYNFRRYDGSVASTVSRASIVRDETGKAIRLIGAIQDVSRLKELEKNQQEQILIEQEQSEVFIQAARLSYDGIWDWNLLTGEFFLGDGFERLFGNTQNKNTGSRALNWGKYLHPDDQEAVEKGLKDAIASSASHWEETCRFIRADGSVARVFGRASIIRDRNGKACRMIGVIHDLSQQDELEEKLDRVIATNIQQFTEYKENFKLFFNSSSDVLYDVDLVANQIIISDAYEKEFGYKITSNMTPAKDWVSHIHPDDKEEVLQGYFRVLASASTEWKCNYRFFRADNSVADIAGSGIILRSVEGKAYRIIGSMQDISKQRVLEERLKNEIKLKENQIKEAMNEAKATERSDLGKELHDNVNQLLGASRLYLAMAKKGGVNSEMYLSRSSDYTQKAIDEIRKLSKGLTTDSIKDLGLCETIEKVCRDTMEINPVIISCALDNLIEDRVNGKFKLNVFRIVQEHLNNILKHAKARKTSIRLTQNKKAITLLIADDGIGFDTHKKQNGIGIINIKSRAAAYNGIAEFISQPGQGCKLSVKFPVINELLKMDLKTKVAV